MPEIQNITDSLDDAPAASGASLDWGVGRDPAVDQQFMKDMQSIREAELSAERSASTLRVF